MNNKKGFVKILLVIVAIIAIALIVYIKRGYRTETIPSDITDNQINSSLQNLSSSTSNEININDNSDNKDNVKDQPGIVNGIQTTSGGWLLTVDYVSRNPKWLPGVGNEPFFLNTNDKLRTLIVSSNATKGKTKFFKCGGNETVSYGPVIEAKIEDFIGEVKKELPTEEPIYYFDVKDETIDAVYTKCLP